MHQGKLEKLLSHREWLLADGATGTNYFPMGLQSGDSPELWNIEYPERVASLHRQFIESGADIILTNSFGGSSYRLKLHQSEGRVAELNQAAASIAREEADRSDREIVVAGSIGPTGDLLQPLGELDPNEAEAAFGEQARALADGGVDVIWLETMSSKEELRAAGIGAIQADLPVVATMTFDTKGHTMMGVSPQELIDLYQDTVPRLTAYGANCGVGAADLIGSMIAIRSRSHDSDFLVAKGNCGIPEFVDGDIRYSGTPELMAEYARLAYDLGVRIIGGCCGTTPEHLAAMRRALVTHQPRPAPDIDRVVELLGPVTPGTRACCDRSVPGLTEKLDLGRAGRRRRSS